MLVALPALEHGHKAACPRCGATLTTEWDAPRQRPTAYAFAALFMLLLSNLFPFIYMKVGGITSEVDLLEYGEIGGASGVLWMAAHEGV
jgi:paraquat-inducible protein A